MISYFVSFFFFYREAVLKFAESRVAKIVFSDDWCSKLNEIFLSSLKFFKHYIEISFASIITYNSVENFEKKKNKQI